MACTCQTTDAPYPMAPTASAAIAARGCGKAPPSASPSARVHAPPASPLKRTKATGSRIDNRCVRFVSSAHAAHAPVSAAAPRPSTLSAPGPAARTVAPAARSTTAAQPRRDKCSWKAITARSAVSGASRFKNSAPGTPGKRRKPTTRSAGPATAPDSTIPASHGASCRRSGASTPRRRPRTAARAPPAPRYSKPAITSGSAAPARILVSGTLAPNTTAASSPQAIPRVTSPVYVFPPRPRLVHAAGGGAALELLDLLARVVQLGADLFELGFALPEPRLRFRELEEQTADLHHQPGGLRRRLGRTGQRADGLRRKGRLRRRERGVLSFERLADVAQDRLRVVRGLRLFFDAALSPCVRAGAPLVDPGSRPS